MSLRENEQQRAQHALRKHYKRKRREKKLQRERRLALDAPLTSLHDDQVLTFSEWVRLNRISERTGRRILDGGNGPTVVMLSPRRIGITIRANREWQHSRERA